METIKKQTSIQSQNTPQNIDWGGVLWQNRTFSHPERTIRVGTSCSGIAAEPKALKQLGLKHEIVFAGDIDKKVKKSFFANYDITEDRWHNDLKLFQADKYKGKVDLFLAGICCQSFSLAGKKDGIEDEERGTLFKDFCRVVRQCEPKVFIMENVINMLRVHGGKDWEFILNACKDLGYDLHYQVLRSNHYDCPQHRERIFLIGFKEPNPDFLFPRPVPLTRNVNHILEPNIPIDFPLDGTDDKGIRPLTPREALRLQVFSDDFKIVLPDTDIYHQAGNSICVNVLKAIFRQMDITKYGI